ncbi:MAG TPA: hypothetical protein VNA17_02525 [Pyrinomonadaceae bacterium]|nr:hypothetical protein [Pyrinomonadaceae bacterium]
MKKWMSGVHGTVLMIVLWVLGWGLGFGGIMEAFVDPDGKIQDVWLTLLAVPGFIGGLLFSGLLWFSEGRRSFNEVSLSRVSLWGIVTGLVIGLLTIPAEVGDVSPGATGMTAIATSLSLVAAIGSAVFFRIVGRRQTSDVSL